MVSSMIQETPKGQSATSLSREQVKHSIGVNQVRVLIYDEYELLAIEGINAQPVYALNFETYLFNEERHLSTQGTDFELLTFYLLDHKRGQTQARLRLFIKENQGFSPLQGTFGGIEYSQMLEQTVLDKFVKLILKNERVTSLKRLVVKEKPTFYATQQAIKFPAFIQDVNQHLFVDSQPFIDKIHPSEKRRLRKCRRAGFVFEEVKNPDFQQLYNFICSHRIRKEMSITITLQKLKELVETLPNDFKVFVVKDTEKVIALVFGVKLNEHALYTFLPADHADYLQFSPSVMLYEGLYDYCFRHNFGILDFGTSSENGVLNEGSFNFKRHLGCLTSEKLTFRKV
jgi:hypothetical protein